MTATTYSAPYNCSTDAIFRAWAKPISDAIAAGGWTLVRTNINWATVSAPVLANTEAGYEVWMTSDGAGKGLSDYYIRIGYGSASSAATTVGITLQTGWGENGAGALTGNTALHTGYNSGAAYQSHIGCGDGYLAMSLNAFSSSTSSHAIFSVERTRDNSGAEEDQLFSYSYTSTSGRYNYVNPLSGTVTANVTAAAGAKAYAAAQLIGIDGTIGVLDLSPMKGKVLMPSLNLLVIDAAQFGESMQCRIQMYGEDHIYQACGVSNGEPMAGTKFLTRYE